MFKVGDEVKIKSYQELVSLNKAPFPKTFQHFCGRDAIVKKVLKKPLDHCCLLDISGTFIWYDFELSIKYKNNFIPLRICL